MFINIEYSRKIKQFIENKFLFGNKLTPELITILTVYFVQGILGLATLAVSFFLKDELMLSPAQVSALMGIAAIPWVTKPIIGFLSDSKPLFGYRRRSYLILSGIIGAIAWVSLATIVSNVWGAVIAILGTSLSIAIADVIVDSVVVERARYESLEVAGSLQSLTRVTSALGGIITAYLSGWLLEFFSTNQVFLITACFPLLIVVVASLIIEQPIAIDDNSLLLLPEHLQQLWGTFKQKSILAPVIFILVWQSTPSADSAFFFFTTNELGFNPEFLGRVRLISSLAAFVGVWCYQRYLKQVPFRLMFSWSVVLSSILGLTSLLLVTHANRTLGIDDHWFSIGDTLILTVMGKIAFMPVLVLSTRLCPNGIEASFFALLMSILNLGGLISHELGALITQWLGVTETNFDHLWLLLLITNLSSLLPLPLVGLLPNHDPQKEAENMTKLPPAEIYEHHSVGSSIGGDMMPEVITDCVKK